MQNKYLLGWLLILIPLCSFADDGTLPLARIATPPIIDGRLDDAVWQQVPFVTGFKTFVPDYGITMAEKTHVYTAYDSENLYFAFRCFDREPDKIKSSVTRRDNIRPDDWVCINLDSFYDQQSLYAFYINPAGIQGDTRYSSGTEDAGVDLVWYSAGQIDSEGYSVEVQIPFKSIRFANKNPVEMGVIFERRISRRAEQGTYPALDPNQGTAFLVQMEPMQLTDIKHYTLFEVLPAVTYSQRSVRATGPDLTSELDQGDLSLTTKLGLSSDLILDGTLNPDFSQVEADAGQVDINNRFDLFFSEKRPFFLEGRENFNFAGSGHGDPLSSIVHTRQIANPEVGVKLSGKVGAMNTIATIYASDDRSNLGEADDRAHFAIGRYKRKLSEDSYLGAVLTARERESGHNRIVGADGEIRLTQASTLGFHALTSQDKPDPQGENVNGHAIGADFQYSMRNLRVSAGFHDLSDDFRTETGFVRRTGITKFRASVSPKFYPHAKVVRRIDPSFSTTQTRDKPSELNETSYSAGMSFVLQRSSRASVFYTHSNEIFLGQKFDTNGLSISGSSQFTNEVFFSVSYNNGKAIRYISDPFQARGQRATASVTLQPSDKINGNFRLTYSDLSRNDNSEKVFDVTIFRSRLTYQLNQYLFFRAIAETNSLRKTLETDFLASFTYIPGTVMHFGYGSFYERVRWQQPEFVASDRYLQTRRGFFAKASYLHRL